jgi:hypothetical protein
MFMVCSKALLVNRNDGSSNVPGISCGLGRQKKIDQGEAPLTSRYLKAGSPICCFLPACRKPFSGTCIHGNDGHFYCSHECAEEGAKIDLTHVEPIRARK